MSSATPRSCFVSSSLAWEAVETSARCRARAASDELADEVCEKRLRSCNQVVANAQSGLFTCPRCHLQNGERTECKHQTSRWNGFANLNDAAIACDTHDVDVEPHAKGMNALRRRDDNRGVRIKRISSQEAAPACFGIDRSLDCSGEPNPRPLDQQSVGAATLEYIGKKMRGRRRGSAHNTVRCYRIRFNT